MATKEVTTSTITLDLGEFKLIAEGILDEPADWTITNSSTIRTTRHTTREYWDEAEAEEYLWEEAMYIIRKYSSLTVEHMTDEVEDDEED
jgi:hypothetical protein